MAPSSETVKVVVRCRPLSAQEVEDNRAIIVTADEAVSELRIAKADDTEPRTFTFDAVYGTTSTQQQIFEKTARPIVDSCIEGYNGTIFAYGQTGAGKSFTMEGKDEPEDLRGIIPNAFNHIFDLIGKGGKDQFLVYVSYLEIYNEELKDLLAPGGPGARPVKLEVKESKERGIFVANLQQFPVKNIQETRSMLAAGKKLRHVGAHAMNAESSRSHSILTIALVAVEKFNVAKAVSPKMHVGKLNLVDLAGSERQGKTQATGERLKEGASINQSLSALGNVIKALSEKGGHVPYRDSKLTRLLQDALGGNTKTVMVANVGPADWNFDETMGTLRYANRAKNIANKPRVNNAPTDASVQEYTQEIAKLREEYTSQIARLKAEHEAEVESLRKQMAGEAGRRAEHSGVIRELRAQLEYGDIHVQALAKAQEEVALAKVQAYAEAQAQVQAEIATAKAEAHAEALAAAQAQIAEARAAAVAAAQAQAAAEVAAARAQATAEVQAQAAAQIKEAKAQAQAAADAAAAASIEEARAQAAAEAQAQAAAEVAAARAQAAAAQQAAAEAAQAARAARTSADARSTADMAAGAAARQREVDSVKAQADTQMTQLQAMLASLQAQGASVQQDHRGEIQRLMGQVQALQARSAAEREQVRLAASGRSMRADQGYTELFERLVLDMGYDADSAREAVLNNPRSTLDEIVDYIAAHEEIMVAWRQLKRQMDQQ